jgi:hypothetical protein
MLLQSLWEIFIKMAFIYVVEEVYCEVLGN